MNKETCVNLERNFSVSVMNASVTLIQSLLFALSKCVHLIMTNKYLLLVRHEKEKYNFY